MQTSFLNAIVINYYIKPKFWKSQIKARKKKNP